MKTENTRKINFWYVKNDWESSFRRPKSTFSVRFRLPKPKYVIGGLPFGHPKSHFLTLADCGSLSISSLPGRPFEKPQKPSNEKFCPSSNVVRRLSFVGSSVRKLNMMSKTLEQSSHKVENPEKCKKNMVFGIFS